MTNTANEEMVDDKLVQVEASKKKGLGLTSYSLISTHAINNIVSIFVSTFLVSYIYSVSENYVFNIGLFYLVQYIFMLAVYNILSIFIDRTNRVVFYRIAIIVRGLFMLSVVLFGKDLAKFVALAGLIHGISEGFYWSSYNIMKNELVPNSFVKSYSTIQLTVEKFISVVVPIALGKIIDAESFGLTAIIVLVIIAVQFIVSFFIKSRRPENSGYDLKGFFQDIKDLGEKKKLVTTIFKLGFVYGIISIIVPLNTVLIMYSFNSNFSLGIITGIISFLSMFMLIFLRFTKPGKRNYIYIMAATLTVVSAFCLIFKVSTVTVIIYNCVYTVLAVVHSYFYDVFRNVMLKKLGLYHDIAEYQCCIENALQVARILVFAIMVGAGLLGSIWGTEGILIATKILLGVSIFALPIFNISLMIYEKKLIKNEII